MSGASGLKTYHVSTRSSWNSLNVSSEWKPQHVMLLFMVNVVTSHRLCFVISMHSFLCIDYLKTLHAGTLAKSVYTELEDLHNQGFKTWVSRIEDMVDSLGVTMGGNLNEFKKHCRSKVINDFINKRYNELNVDHKPLLRTYCLFKFGFGTESYLYNVKDVRYRSAIYISKLRAIVLISWR